MNMIAAMRILYLFILLCSYCASGQLIPDIPLLTKYTQVVSNFSDFEFDSISFRDSLRLHQNISNILSEKIKLSEAGLQNKLFKLVPELPEITPLNPTGLGNLLPSSLQQVTDHFKSRSKELNSAINQVEAVKKRIGSVEQIIQDGHLKSGSIKKYFRPNNLITGMRFSPRDPNRLTTLLAINFSDKIIMGAGYIFNLNNKPSINSWRGILYFLNIAFSNGTFFCIDVERMEQRTVLGLASGQENIKQINWHLFPGIRRTVYATGNFELHAQIGIDVLHKNSGAYREPFSGKVGITWKFLRLHH